MKRYWIILLASLSLIVTSCIKDDKITTDDYCYISGVTLGSVKRAVHTTSSSGEDSTYYTSYTGSQFPMAIDQRKQLIENRDSLLYGTDLTAVLVNITYDGSVVAYRTAGTDENWTTYSSSDSMDLRKPLELYVVANNADIDHPRIYTLQVNVHQQEGDSLYWSKGETNVVALTGMTEMQAAVIADQLAVLGSTIAGIQLATRSGLSATESWEVKSTNLPTTTEVRTLKQCNDAWYVSSSDGQLYSSTDGITWQTIGTPQAGLQLIGATNDYFYSVINGGIYLSNDAITWNIIEKLDASADYLPTSNITSMQFTQENGNERLVTIGYRDNAADSTAVVWNKMWNATCPEIEAEWVYFTQTAENHYDCPKLKYLNILKYDNKCWAFGGTSITGTRIAMDKLYISNDYGITWYPDLELHLPTALKGVEGSITSVVDKNNVIWIITNNQVWFGRLNRLGFLRQ